MYEIVVGRELRDEETILITPNFGADANRAAIIDCIGQILRDAVASCVGGLVVDVIQVGDRSDPVGNQVVRASPR
jgi:hypothetical protein